MANIITFAVVHAGTCHVLTGEKRDGQELHANINAIIHDAQIHGYDALGDGDRYIPLSTRGPIQYWNRHNLAEFANIVMPGREVTETEMTTIINRLTSVKTALEQATLNFTTEVTGHGRNLETRHKQLEAAKKALQNEIRAYSQILGQNELLDDCVMALGQAQDIIIYGEAPKADHIEHGADRGNAATLLQAAAQKYAEVKKFYTEGKGQFASEEHKNIEVAKAVAAIKVYHAKALSQNNTFRLSSVFTDHAQGYEGSYHVDLHLHGKPFTSQEFSSRAVNYLLNGKSFDDSTLELTHIQDRAVFSTKQNGEIKRLRELKQKLAARGSQTDYTKLLTRGLGWVAMAPVIGGRALMYGRDRTFEEIIQIANGKSDGDWLPQFPSRGAISDEERGYLLALLQSEEEGVQYEEARVQAAKKLAIACDAKARQILESHAGGRKSIAQTCSDIKAIDIASQRGVELKDKTIAARNSALVQLANVSDAMLHDVFPQLEMLGRIHFDIFPTNVLGLMTPAVRGIWNSGAILNNFETLQERIKGARVFGGDGLFQVLKKAIAINEAYLQAHLGDREAASQVLEDYMSMLQLIPSYTSRLHNSAGDAHVETKEYPGFKTTLGRDLMDIKKKLEEQITRLDDARQHTAEGFAQRLRTLRPDDANDLQTRIDTLLAMLSQGTRILVPNAALRAQYYNAIADSLRAFERAISENGDTNETFTALTADIDNMIPHQGIDARGKPTRPVRAEPRRTDFNRCLPADD